MDRENCKRCFMPLKFHPDFKHCPGGTEVLSNNHSRRIAILENMILSLHEKIDALPASPSNKEKTGG